MIAPCKCGRAPKLSAMQFCGEWWYRVGCHVPFCGRRHEDTSASVALAKWNADNSTKDDGLSALFMVDECAAVAS